MSKTTPEPDPELISRVLEGLTEDADRPASELLPMVYEELRRLAQSRLAKLAPGQTLQATALVHEAWIRLVGEADPGWECRAHFFGAAAQAMRNILVEQVRKKTSLKRDAGRIEFDGEPLSELRVGDRPEDVLILDDALNRLEAKDPRKARIVELRFFAGLSMPAVARVLGLPLTRVERDWRFTRAWLQKEVDGLRAG